MVIDARLVHREGTLLERRGQRLDRRHGGCIRSAVVVSSGIQLRESDRASRGRRAIIKSLLSFRQLYILFALQPGCLTWARVAGVVGACRTHTHRIPN